MNITPLKTHPLIPGKETDILSVIDQYVTDIKEGSVLAVTSKIVSICEGRFVKESEITKEELVAKEAEMYIPRFSKYEFTVTITNNILGASAGIDSSNGNGYFILWPKNPQESANRIREHLATKFGRKHIGVIITDSKTSFMRWGVTGIALSHSGFSALKDYIGTPDIFGREFQYEKLHVADCLATAAVLTMGEGNEQLPLCVLSDIPTIEFQERNPTKEELDSLIISIEDDFYGPFLKNAQWIKTQK